MNTTKLSANVCMCQGKPVLHINGQPVLPVMYSLTSIPGGRWSWEEIPSWDICRFGEAGIHLHQVDFNL